MFAKIHQSTNRRLGVWRQLDQIQRYFFGLGQPFYQANDTELLSLCADQPNTFGRNIIIDAILFICDS
jgi:hypothetical protein